MRKTEMFTGGYYHVYNRGVDRRVIFDSDGDFRRFYAALAVFNDINYQDANFRSFEDAVRDVRNRVSDTERLVDILSFCLLPNHFHILVRQCVDSGVAKFMQKLQLGYTKYFNLKNQRSGRLFQGPYQSVYAGCQAQLEHLPCYIHLNTPTVEGLGWRDGQAHSEQELLRRLAKYHWSSHNQYLTGEQELPVVFDRAIGEIFSSVSDYIRSLTGWSTRNCLKPGFEHEV